MPTLIEPGVRYFLCETLKQCHIKKYKIYNLYFNIGIFLLFISIFTFTLYYRYKKKLTPEQLKEKQRQREKYISQKIRSIQLENKKKDNTIITNLPRFESI